MHAVTRHAQIRQVGCLRPCFSSCGRGDAGPAKETGPRRRDTGPAGELTSRPGRSRSGPDAIEIDLELREERRAQAGRALVLDDEPVRVALQLVVLPKAGAGLTSSSPSRIS